MPSLSWGLWLGLWLSVSPQVQQELDAGAQAFATGDNASALVQWSLALKQARQEQDPEGQAAALLGLSAANRSLGRLEQASELAQMAGQAGAHPAQVGIAQGLVLLDQGRAKQAERRFAKAFEQAQSSARPSLAADAANNLGLARAALGELQSADKALSVGVSLMRTLGDTRGLSDALNNRGLVRRRAGQLRLAQADLEAAVQGFRAAKEWGGEGDALANLGLVFQDLGQDHAAQELYQAALASAQQRRDVQRQGVLLLALGTLAHQRQELQQAARYYAAAEQAFETAGQPQQALGPALNLAALEQDPERYAAILKRAETLGAQRVQATAALNLGALSADRAPIERALKIADQLELREVQWRAHYLLGALAIAAGEPGLQELRLAVDQLERTRRALDAPSSQSFVTRYEQVYTELIGALLAEGDSLGAYVYAERLQLAGMEAPPAPQGPQALRYQALVEQEAWLAGQLTQSIEHGELERSETLRQELAALRVEFAQTVDTLRATYPNFDQLVRVDPEDLEAVQGSLDPGVAVLQPILFSDKLVLLLVQRDSLRAVTVEVDPAKVRRTISRLTRSLRAQLIDDPEWTQEMAAELGAWLIQPADLRGVHTLVVSATGPFQQLPFGMLRVHGQYLVESMAVANITHVGSLRPRGAATPRYSLSGPGLLLVGNPDGSLPQAEAEVQAIARQFPSATLVTGSLESRAQLLELTSDKGTVHLATHGVVDPLRPTQSYLVLGGGAQGHLAYGEIPGLAPYLADTRLVVLSACESGLPVTAPERPGDELAISIHGLSAQFRRAGVETLVASLWKVDDGGTRALMEGFYGHLGQGQDVAQAMRSAQLQLLASEQMSHPWFWASFVVVGDWR